MPTGGLGCVGIVLAFEIVAGGTAVVAYNNMSAITNSVGFMKDAMPVGTGATLGLAIGLFAGYHAGKKIGQLGDRVVNSAIDCFRKAAAPCKSAVLATTLSIGGLVVGGMGCDYGAYEFMKSGALKLHTSHQAVSALTTQAITATSSAPAPAH